MRRAFKRAVVELDHKLEKSTASVSKGELIVEMPFKHFWGSHTYSIYTLDTNYNHRTLLAHVLRDNKLQYVLNALYMNMNVFMSPLLKGGVPPRPRKKIVVC